MLIKYTGKYVNIYFIMKITYFKNTDYLLVKTALLFSLENFQNCVVSRGRLGSQPPLSHRVTPETSPWRSARVPH